MRRLLLACVAAALVPAVTPARAAGGTYGGGCGFLLARDSTPAGQLGGVTAWQGVVELAVVARDTTGLPTTGTAWCEVRVNGLWSRTAVGPTSNEGVIADVAPLVVQARDSDVVTLCTHVLIGTFALTDCDDATVSRVVPQPVADLVDAASTSVGQLAGPLLCPLLRQAAPGTWPVAIGNDGDVYVAAQLDDTRLLDCAPTDPDGTMLDPYRHTVMQASTHA